MIVANSDGQGPLRHKQEKAMVNEFGCALKLKAYTKAYIKSITIKLLAVQLEENFARPWPICTVILLTPSHVPAIQPIYQNVLEICLEVDNFYIAWLGYRYPP